MRSWATGPDRPGSSGYSDSATRLATSFEDGQRPEYDENHAFFLATAPIRRGVALSSIVSRDVAPTLAQSLGLAMPDVDRPPLARIFA